MKHSISWLFARRYLLSRKSHSVINIVASVSLVAVAVPVAAMVILLSVFNGFESLVHDMYAAVDADICCVAEGADAVLRDRIAEIEGVEAASCFVERQAIADYHGRRTTVRLRGVDERYEEVIPIACHVKIGSSAVLHGEEERIVMGDGVANHLGIYSITSDSVALYSIGGGRVGSLLPLGSMHREAVVVGGFLSIGDTFDSTHALVPISFADRLFSAGGVADGIAVKVRHGEVATKVAATIEREAEGVRCTTREQKNIAFYRIMRYEKWGVFLVSLLVLIIASLSIIGTTIMLIVEKQDERPVLRSMGMDSADCRRIFVCESLLISGIGACFGLVLGVGVVLAQQCFHIVQMPAGNFLTSDYPVRLDMADLVVVALTATLLAIVVAWAATRFMIRNEKITI